MAFYLLVLLYFILNMVIFIGHHFYSPVEYAYLMVMNDLLTSTPISTDLALIFKMVSVNLICKPVKDRL